MSSQKPFKNYYSVLGLPRNSSDEEITSAFRRISLENHPDTGSGDPNKFKEANEAFNTLGRGGLNKEARHLYDRDYDLLIKQSPRETWQAGSARAQNPTEGRRKTTDEILARIKKETDEALERIMKEGNARIERLKREQRERTEKLSPKADKTTEQARRDRYVRETKENWDKAKRETKENWDRIKKETDRRTEEFLRGFNKDSGKIPKGNIDSGENKG